MLYPEACPPAPPCEGSTINYIYNVLCYFMKILICGFTDGRFSNSTLETVLAHGPLTRLFTWLSDTSHSVDVLKQMFLESGLSF